MNRNISQSGKHTLFTFITIFLLTLGTSQCFAESAAATANPKNRKSMQYLEIIQTLYYYVQQKYVDEVDPRVLYEGALRGMLNALGDPYTTYMDKDEWRSITDTTTGNFGGVGLSITKPNVSTPEKPAYVQVAQPIDNSPGARAGIQAGDYIIKINGVDTDTITMNDVLGMLRGTVGESVTVTIRRGKSLVFDKTLIRAIIENPTVTSGMIGTVGYLRISEFSANTSERVQEALNTFAANGYTALVIDLRNNGGGLLSAAVEIADKFIDSGTIVSTKSRIAYENIVYPASKSATTVKDVPIVVLINGGTASASEILSGALKDHHKAYLVGARTFGKGSVQIPSALLHEDEDGFKITVARYYSPSDTNIDKIGIPPDREVTYPDFTDEEAKDYQSLMESDEIAAYVEAHPAMSEDDISAYAQRLYATYRLDQRILRKLIRNEVERTKPARLYDLDYDLQLNEALTILRSEDFPSLVAHAKTLRELQDEAEVSQSH